MDDTILSLKTQLLEREREIAALKKKLHQMEKVCNSYSVNSANIQITKPLWDYVPLYVCNDFNNEYLMPIYMCCCMAWKQYQKCILRFRLGQKLKLYYNYFSEDKDLKAWIDRTAQINLLIVGQNNLLKGTLVIWQIIMQSWAFSCLKTERASPPFYFRETQH